MSKRGHGETADVAPGDDDEAGGLTSYAIGLLLASGLTAASFLLPATGVVWGPAVPAALIVLAIAQMGVHLVFFLHITSGPDNTNNSLALAFGTLIVLLVVLGSVWIMTHLNHMHMTMPELMKQMR